MALEFKIGGKKPDEWVGARDALTSRSRFIVMLAVAGIFAIFALLCVWKWR